MEPLERGHSTTRGTTRKLSPAHMGGWLLSRARYIKLTSQHRASGDAAHTALLNKMSDTGHIGMEDLKHYKQLSSEDLASDDFRFATMIVSGNNERREINARQAKRWAEHFKLNNVRWARTRRNKRGKGNPERTTTWLTPWAAASFGNCSSREQRDTSTHTASTRTLAWQMGRRSSTIRCRLTHERMK